MCLVSVFDIPCNKSKYCEYYCVCFSTVLSSVVLCRFTFVANFMFGDW